MSDIGNIEMHQKNRWRRKSMKLIDHVTKKEIGDMEFRPFRVNEKFRMRTEKGASYFIVTGVDYSGDGKLFLFEMTKEQWDRGLEIKDLLV
jgi:hypothetical protein